MRQALIVSVLLVSAAPVWAGQPTSTPSPTVRFGALRPAPTNPYRQLFDAQKSLKSAVEVAQPPASRSRVVCGMLIIPADPNVDPKIARPPNKAPNLAFTIRTMEPPICNPAK